MLWDVESKLRSCVDDSDDDFFVVSLCVLVFKAIVVLLLSLPVLYVVKEFLVVRREDIVESGAVVIDFVEVCAELVFAKEDMAVVEAEVVCVSSILRERSQMAG